MPSISESDGVHIAKFLRGYTLSKDLLSIISKKVAGKYTSRLREQAMMRRTSPNDAQEKTLSVNNELKISLENVRQDQLLPSLASHEENAALKIQQIARGNAARTMTARMIQDVIDNRTNEALLQDGFLEMAADILRNTVFNLLQEASYGEFAINSDPLKFMIKR